VAHAGHRTVCPVILPAPTKTVDVVLSTALQAESDLAKEKGFFLAEFR